jgi:dTDP-4-amino-4,6-dideoxygalactose transaminase
MKIPFNKPYMNGKELEYIAQAHANGHLSGNGQFTKKCQAWLEQTLGCHKAMLTHSCTAALEMAAILADIKPGDEIIMPAYTFVSTANAFVLRGGVPVFIDIRPDTLNIDETKIESAMTNKTKVIVPVHYAGVPCEMDAIMKIAKKHNLLVIEDSAQGILSTYKGRPLGSIGHLSAMSFHETKNIISGEGGALLINDERLIDRAEIIWDKGTNRSRFFRGQVDKYTWVDIGSSYLPSELIAAFLWAQLEDADAIMRTRMSLWETYNNVFAPLNKICKIRGPFIPDYCTHNAHMYYLILPNLQVRTDFINALKTQSISAVFHYIPLHDSPAGKRYGRAQGDLSITNEISARLVRLPLWINMGDNQRIVIEHIMTVLKNLAVL